MKKIFLLASFCVAFLGCKKNPFDFRSKFIGDYNFQIQASSYYGVGPYFSSHDTTYSIDGNIVCGSENDKISISFANQNGSSEFTIYEDGTIEDGNCSGEFESTHTVKYSCFWGSPGAGTYETVTGKKK